jgi:hypothetical protein
MAVIETPDRGQPLDISYLYRMVNELNNVSQLVGSGISKIKYRDTSTPAQPRTGNLVFYAETLKITDSNLSTQTNATATFDYSGLFKTTPVVVASVTSLDGVSNLYTVLEKVTQNNCNVNIFSSSTGGAFSADVSIIAIGERISS